MSIKNGRQIKRKKKKKTRSYLFGSTPLRMMSRKSDMMSLSWTSSSTTWLTEDNNLWNIRFIKTTIQLIKSGTAGETNLYKQHDQLVQLLILSYL